MTQNSKPDNIYFTLTQTTTERINWTVSFLWNTPMANLDMRSHAVFTQEVVPFVFNVVRRLELSILVVTYHTKGKNKLQFHFHDLIKNTCWKRTLIVCVWIVTQPGRYKHRMFHHQGENFSRNSSLLYQWFLIWTSAIPANCVLFTNQSGAHGSLSKRGWNDYPH